VMLVGPNRLLGQKVIGEGSPRCRARVAAIPGHQHRHYDIIPGPDG
jgi:hypothetical protein